MDKKVIFGFFVLYFLQGLPYGLQTRFLPLFFRSHGMSLTNIGLYKLLLIPWVLKALFAPVVDNYGRKKVWMVVSIAALGFLCLIASQIPQESIMLLAALLFCLNLVTATQDIAVDAMLIDVSTSSELAMGNTAQVVGYKGGALFTGGLYGYFVESLSWESIFFSQAILYMIGLIICILVMPDAPTHAHHIDPAPSIDSTRGTSDPALIWAFINYCKIIMRTNGTKWLMKFMLLYKLGEGGFMSMFPLFLIDKGIAPKDVGIWTGGLGQTMSIIGSSVGSVYFTKSMVTNLKIQQTGSLICQMIILAVVAFWDDMKDFILEKQIPFISPFGLSLSLFMMISFFSGAITTCVFTLAMQLAQKAPRRYQAGHYTLMATTEVLGKLFFSSFVGAITQHMGYIITFLVFIFLSLISVPMIFRAPRPILSLGTHMHVSRHADN